MYTKPQPDKRQNNYRECRNVLPITFCSQIFANLKVNVYLCSDKV